jgi:hypothetical protein
MGQDMESSQDMEPPQDMEPNPSQWGGEATLSKQQWLITGSSQWL